MVRLKTTGREILRNYNYLKFRGYHPTGNETVA